MRVRMHSFYDHFPHHNPVANEPFVDCYNDSFCAKSGTEPNAIALLIEPRSIDRHGYEWIEQHPDQYKYVFTHDSKLLNTLPNARLICYGGVWSWSDEQKTRFCSIVSSDKEMCELHRFRKKLAHEFKNKVDVFGTIDGGNYVSTYESHAPYRYAIIIENHIDDYWFTEKICNCFANKVVPIYLGAKKISEFFNSESILSFQSPAGIRDCVNVMSTGYGENWYDSRIKAIEDNYNRVKAFENFETWFFNKYDELLGGLV